MSDIFRPDYTSHGNYKCPYCNHRVWKSEKIATTHIKNNHEVEALTDALAERDHSLEDKK